MENQEINDIAKETLFVLDCFNSDFTDKISKKFINELEELAKTSNKTFKIDRTKTLEEQNISSETKDMIALIYYSYIASEDEKKEITKIWNENEISYQENLREQYNPDNLFKKKNPQSEDLPKEENLAMIEYKKNIFQKIMEKIKIFLKKLT